MIFSELELPRLSGLSLLRSLDAERTTFPVILLPRRAEVEAVIKSGVDLLMPPITAKMIHAAISRMRKPESFSQAFLREAFKLLTAGELEITELVVAGMSTAQIATKLNVHPRTVDKSRQTVKMKARVQDTGELMRM